MRGPDAVGGKEPKISTSGSHQPFPQFPTRLVYITHLIRTFLLRRGAPGHRRTNVRFSLLSAAADRTPRDTNPTASAHRSGELYKEAGARPPFRSSLRDDQRGSASAGRRTALQVGVPRSLPLRQTRGTLTPRGRNCRPGQKKRSAGAERLEVGVPRVELTAGRRHGSPGAGLTGSRGRESLLSRRGTSRFCV